MTPADSTLHRLIASMLGGEATHEVLATLEIHPSFGTQGAIVSRAMFAMALNAVLFAGLLARTPTAAAYVADVRRAGGRVCFDHGALRTVRLARAHPGARPMGEAAFTRILGPLGYKLAGTYPLERLRMTGRAYAHADLPEALPQVFVSELHVDQLPYEAQLVANRVFGATREPLRVAARTALRVFDVEGWSPFSIAASALPEISAAFGRWHDLPSLEDYHLLLEHSAEAAWIATEGNAFNHATDRVPDVEGLAADQRRLGRPIKDAVEVSSAGGVRQTAFRADPVERELRSAAGPVRLTVPGSFYEFIARAAFSDEAGVARLDLRFDSSNAQGIFKMTEAK